MRSSSWEEGEADKDDLRHPGGVGILGLYNQPVPPGWSQMRGGGEGKTPWSSSPRTPHPMGVALGHLPPWEGPAASAPPLLLGVKAVFQLECLGSSLPAVPPIPCLGPPHLARAPGARTGPTSSCTPAIHFSRS